MAQSSELPSSEGLGDALNALWKQGESIASISDIPYEQRTELIGPPSPFSSTMLASKFSPAERRISTEDDKRRLQEYYMESFLIGQIPEEPSLCLGEEIKTFHRLFPIWRAIRIEASHKRGKSGEDDVCALEALTLEGCVPFAFHKFAALQKESEQLPPGTPQQINVSMRMGYWGRIYEVAKGATAYHSSQ